MIKQLEEMFKDYLVGTNIMPNGEYCVEIMEDLTCVMFYVDKFDRKITGFHARPNFAYKEYYDNNK